MYYVDNQPNYYTTMGPPFKEVGYDILAKSEVEHTDDTDMCDPTHQRFFVRIKEVVGPMCVGEIKQLLSRALVPSSCYHEYDCCGCRHGRASVKMLTMDTAEIEVYTMRNY